MSNLPVEILQWLADNGFLLESSVQLQGKFAAQIVVISAQDPGKKQIRIIFKRVPFHSREAILYKEMRLSLSQFMPFLYDIVPLPDGYGILMEKFGDSLNRNPAYIKQIPASVSLGKRLSQVVVWLVQMHGKLRQASSSLQAVFGSYPIQTAQLWRNSAINNLEWGTCHGLLSHSALTQIREMEGAFSQAVQKINAFHSVSSAGTLQTVTHGDCHFGNILYKNDEFRLIDWEYACISEPQRDLAALLQDVQDESLLHSLYTIFQSHLRNAGWPIKDSDYIRTFYRHFFDNTLMMLGWDVGNFRDGLLTPEEITEIVQRKIRWIQKSFDELRI